MHQDSAGVGDGDPFRNGQGVGGIVRPALLPSASPPPASRPPAMRPQPSIIWVEVGAVA